MSRRLVLRALPVLGALAMAAPASAAPAPPVSLSFVQRTASVPTLQLTAKAPTTARMIVFGGRWVGTDGVRRSYELGTDRVASNGFSIGWNASRVPTGTTVSLTARAVDARGRTVGTSSVKTWRAGTKPSSSGSTATVTGTVDGTCAQNPRCTVSVRNAPSTSGTRLSELAEGTRVTVRCRATGQLVSTPDASSKVWLQIAEGRWVSALYVATPSAAKIPTCTA